jgi:hypothetical protein
MKRKFAYGLLGVGVVLLIAVIALVVQSLLRLSMSDPFDADIAEDQASPFRRPRADSPVAGTPEDARSPALVTREQPGRSTSATAQSLQRSTIPATRTAPAATPSVATSPTAPASPAGTSSARNVPAPPRPSIAKPGRPQAPVADGAVGTVASLNGTATAFHYEGEEEKNRILKEGASIFLNEIIETMDKSRVIIEFVDGTSIAQGAKSVIQIESYLFDANNKPRNRFTMRLTRGLCKLVTGAITDLNPERFKIRTRLATIGIRGTQLLLKSDHTRSDTYVIELSPTRRVRVEAARDGRQILNVHSGESVVVDDADAASVEVDRRGVLISVIEGQGMTHERYDPAEARALLDTLAMRPAARYDLFQTPNGSTIELHRKQPGSDDEP